MRRDRQSGRECGRVAALRQRYDYRVVRALAVIFAKLVAQPAGIDAHNGISRPIEALSLAVKLRADAVLFQGTPLARESPLGNKPKKRAQPLRARKKIARKDSRQLFADVRLLHRPRHVGSVLPGSV